METSIHDTVSLKEMNKGHKWSLKNILISCCKIMDDESLAIPGFCVTQVPSVIRHHILNDSHFSIHPRRPLFT